MKNLRIISIILVYLLTLGLVLFSCDLSMLPDIGKLPGSTNNTNADDDPLILTGTSDGKTVTIKISQTDPSRVVLTPKGGEFYEIKVDGTLISKGKLLVYNSIWAFIPSSDSPGGETQFIANYSNEILVFPSIPGTDITNLTATREGSNTADNRPNLTGTVTINNTSPKVGDNLAATYSDGNGSGTATWQWLRDDAVINSSNSNTYIVAFADEGKTLRAQVSYANQKGSVTSAATDAVPVVSGSGIGTGSASDPFLVHDVVTLQKVGSGTDGWTLDANYKQTDNIDLSSVPNWTPIGTSSATPFTGSYDGNGKTISSLTISTPIEYYNHGLFGTISSDAVVKNVGLVNCTIVGNVFVGGVVGWNQGTVQNCYVTGIVSGEKEVGGVVGVNNSTIQNCYSTGTVSGDLYIGGVVGVNGSDYNRSGMVQYCFATGSVSGDRLVGGVAGVNFGTVQNCYATGNVLGNGASDYITLVGGVAGENSGTVQYCYATGNVSGTGSEAGGVVGVLINPSKTRESTVQNCIGLNLNVSIANTGIGRVVGYSSSFYGTPIMTNNYGWKDMKKNGSSSPAWTNDLNNLDGASITSANWGNQSWWTTVSKWETAGWDFTDVWEWKDGSLPTLRNMPGGTTQQNPVVL